MTERRRPGTSSRMAREDREAGNRTPAQTPAAATRKQRSEGGCAGDLRETSEPERRSVESGRRAWLHNDLLGGHPRRGGRRRARHPGRRRFETAGPRVVFPGRRGRRRRRERSREDDARVRSERLERVEVPGTLGRVHRLRVRVLRPARLRRGEPPDRARGVRVRLVPAPGRGGAIALQPSVRRRGRRRRRRAPSTTTRTRRRRRGWRRRRRRTTPRRTCGGGCGRRYRPRRSRGSSTTPRTPSGGSTRTGRGGWTRAHRPRRKPKSRTRVSRPRIDAGDFFLYVHAAPRRRLYARCSSLAPPRTPVDVTSLALVPGCVLFARRRLAFREFALELGGCSARRFRSPPRLFAPGPPCTPSSGATSPRSPVLSRRSSALSFFSSSVSGHLALFLPLLLRGEADDRPGGSSSAAADLPRLRPARGG